MNKAFVKEGDGTLDEDEGDAPEEKRMPQGFVNYITPPGAARMRDELHKLLHVERPEVVRVVAWAASNGDRSENGDYIYGKRRLREIDRRIRFLSRRLESARIIDPATQSGTRVLFGATVKLAGEDGVKKIYKIVGVDEVDPARGHISWISPVAKALLNANEGDVVVAHTPKGEAEFEIIGVTYE
ncbi:MAG: transcription elongation factor GreB [Bdellovibrionales bacterium RIFOXYD1_FULL_53_11]|nr:MAG: transcription elongation factor GreB [Bdellovibrionales bacterium RIFOXYD1_FULL_53_11]